MLRLQASRSFALLAAAGALVATVLLSRQDALDGRAGDVDLFANAGARMLSGQWLHTFHLSLVQAGPLELALAAVARDIGGGAAGFAIALDLICVVAVLAAAWRVLPRRALVFALLCAGLVALRLVDAPYTGHPAEILIALLWLLGAQEARRGRLLAAGALVGLSGCLELWGVLGVTVLALAPLRRRTAWAVALAGLLPLLALAPFILGGDFRMFDMRWATASGLPRALFGPGHFYGWPLRLGEGACVILVGAAAAFRLRSVPEAVWVVPAVTVLARIALDPVSYGYYWATPLVLLVLGGAAILGRPGDVRDRIAGRLPSGTRLSGS